MDEQLDNAKVNKLVEFNEEMESDPTALIESMVDYLKSRLSNKV